MYHKKNRILLSNKILHITTVHPRRDTRIFYRECKTIGDEGHDIILIVADGKGDEFNEGVQVYDIGKENSRIVNFFKSFGKLKKKIRKIAPDIVHFHDPELMFLGKSISRMGIPVVFDIHENVSAQILDKDYIPKFLRKFVSYFYRKVEINIIKAFHLIIAEHSYEDVYQGKGKSLTTLLNLPDSSHFNPYINLNRTGNEVFYIGAITQERGLGVTLESLKILKQRNVDFFMHFIGRAPDEIQKLEQFEEIKNNIKFYGRMDSKKGFEISKNCVVGLSVLKPIKNYVGSYSTKIFEYMAIGLPVITSNFPLYKGVVEKYNCGFCIDPYSSIELADKIEEIIKNPSYAQSLGSNGLNAVKQNFNWSNEKNKLVELYKQILNG